MYSNQNDKRQKDKISSNAGSNDGPLHCVSIRVKRSTTELLEHESLSDVLYLLL